MPFKDAVAPATSVACAPVEGAARSVADEIPQAMVRRVRRIMNASSICRRERAASGAIEGSLFAVKI
jgi:hypothetical protein